MIKYFLQILKIITFSIFLSFSTESYSLEPRLEIDNEDYRKHITSLLEEFNLTHIQLQNPSLWTTSTPGPFTNVLDVYHKLSLKERQLLDVIFERLQSLCTMKETE